jgi:hypothetical protein
MARAEQCVGSASTDFDGRKWPLSATAFPEAIYSIFPSCVVYGDKAELQGSPWLYNTAFYLKVSVISRLCIPKVSVKSRLFLWASKREAQLKSGPEGLPAAACSAVAPAASIYTKHRPAFFARLILYPHLR